MKPLAGQSWIKEPGAGFASKASERVMELPRTFGSILKTGLRSSEDFRKEVEAFGPKRSRAFAEGDGWRGD